MEALYATVSIASAVVGWLSGVYGATKVIRAELRGELRGLRRDIDRHEQEIRELRRVGV